MAGYWWAVIVGGLLLLPLLALFVDFLLLVARSLRNRDSSVRELMVSCWFVTVYKWRRTPRIPLRGLKADVEGLYSGEMVLRVAEWWNAFLVRRPAFQRIAGARPLGRDEVVGLQRSISAENRNLLVAKARSLAPFDTLAEACFALAYAFARVFGEGSGSETLERWVTITAADLEAHDRHYSLHANILASDLLDVPSEGWWREIELMGLWNRLTVEAIRRGYTDQVRRWEKAEGRTMGKGIGFSGYETDRLVDSFDELLFEHGARFYEVERSVAAFGHVAN